MDDLHRLRVLSFFIRVVWGQSFSYFAETVHLLLLIDNYDSFVHNLARYFKRLGQETKVVRNDAISPAEVAELKPDAIVISPGPCTPDEAGVSLQVIREFSGMTPILGVCLGHQAIGQAFGGETVRNNSPTHGESADVFHDGSGIFKNVKSPFKAARYHSLVISKQSLPDPLRPTAHLVDGTIMAVQHRTDMTFGVQFHPESILTESGYQVLANFLAMIGVSSGPMPSPEWDFSAKQDDSGSSTSNPPGYPYHASH